MAWVWMQASEVAREIDRRAAERRKKAEQAESEAKQNGEKQESAPSGKDQLNKAVKPFSCVRLKDGREVTIIANYIEPDEYLARNGFTPGSKDLFIVKRDEIAEIVWEPKG